MKSLKNQITGCDHSSLVIDNINELPFAPREVAERYMKLLKADWSEPGIMDELHDISSKYTFDAIIFEGSDGKKGLKDCLGKTLVPAKYDGFSFIPKPLEYPRESAIAVRDEKYYVVALDGSGKELTTQGYDYINLIYPEGPFSMYSPYYYCQKGLKSCGFISMSGEEMCDCIVDELIEGMNGVTYRSGDKLGYWQFGVIFLPPIYDNIELSGESSDPMLFTLDGVQGFVRHEDGTFMPLSEYKKLDEDEQHDTLWEYICEQYEME